MNHKRELIPMNGNWYKANLHSHTTLSDGCWTPEQLKKEYQKQGYAIVAYTDHRHYEYHKELEDENFLPLAGFEADITQSLPNTDWNELKCYHLNFYDTNPQERINNPLPASLLAPSLSYEDTGAINQYIGQMKELGFFASYNHPRWSLQDSSDYAGLANLFAMEIYNHGCEVDGLYGYNPDAYDQMLRSGQRLFCFSTDDNHNRHPLDSPLCDSFGGFTMIKAENLSYSSVVQAMQKGYFFSSNGPSIQQLTLEGNVLHISCSPVAKLALASQGRNYQVQVAKPDNPITRTQFTLTGNEKYIRVDCYDQSGNFAHSNPFWL